jgi:hypothetical protein
VRRSYASKPTAGRGEHGSGRIIWTVPSAHIGCVPRRPRLTPISRGFRLSALPGTYSGALPNGDFTGGHLKDCGQSVAQIRFARGTRCRASPVYQTVKL